MEVISVQQSCGQWGDVIEIGRADQTHQISQTNQIDRTNRIDHMSPI